MLVAINDIAGTDVPEDVKVKAMEKLHEWFDDDELEELDEFINGKFKDIQ